MGERWKVQIALSERASVVGPGAFVDVIMAEESCLCILGSLWLRFFCHWSFTDCKSYFLIHAILQGTSTWGMQLRPGLSAASSWHPKWLREEALCWWSFTYTKKTPNFGKIRVVPSTLHGMDPSPSIDGFQSTTRKKFKLPDFTRSLSMYTYCSPVNYIILFWSDPLMIWFQ